MELLCGCLKNSAFGEADIDSASVVKNNLRFAGQHYDAETGWNYNYHRYYDPRTGRYLTPDPIGLAGGINLYAYVQNNPINSIDPYGLLVLVGQHPAFSNDPRNPYNHAAIALLPDNPADFANNRFFANTNGTVATLSAHAEVAWNWSGKVVFLSSTPNYQGDDPCNLHDLTIVATPQGMSDTDFINALINSTQSYNNDFPYNPWPVQGGVGYNSNSYVSGVITNAGGIPPKLPGKQPGYSVPLPLRNP